MKEEIARIKKCFLLDFLLDFFYNNSLYCPNAKLFIHETWGYEDGSERLKEELMYADIQSAYQKAAKLIQADGMIPSGKAMFYATKFGVEKIRRDTYHASLGAGRYLLALTWYKALSGKDISNNDFDDFDVPVSTEEREAVIKAVNLAFETKLPKEKGCSANVL